MFKKLSELKFENFGIGFIILREVRLYLKNYQN